MRKHQTDALSTMFLSYFRWSRIIAWGCSIDRTGPDEEWLWELPCQVRAEQSTTTVQSFSSVVHAGRRLTGTNVALFFRAEEGRIAFPGSAKLPRSYQGMTGTSVASRSVLLASQTWHKITKDDGLA